MAARKLPSFKLSLKIGRLPLGRLAAGLSAAIVLSAVGRVAFFDDPGGGRPVAISKVELAAPIVPEAPADPMAAKPESDAETAPVESAALHDATAPEPHAEMPEPMAAPKRPPVTLSEEDRLLAELGEETRFGTVPRMAGNGVTPFDTFRRPAPEPLGPPPYVALVVTGLGMNLDLALNATTSLPPEVSMAFTSYAPTLDQSAGTARTSGHEIFLEVPLEPFDYPDNDPGPDTLLMGQPPRDNIDRLLKVMSSFQGYAGMINRMGARFTASAPDLGPVIEELSGRGLSYLDDGSSSRSLAEQLATARRMPFARIDKVIDAEPSSREILAALADLEARAMNKGQAIGMLSGLPISVTLVSEWLKSLPEKGITLVPVSMLMKERNAKP